MATRVTAPELKEIFETDLSDPQLRTFIGAANLVVNDRLSGRGIASATLKEIERFVAAHMASVSDPRVTKETIDTASATFEARVRSDSRQGLEMTFYGQQAMLLDPTGQLAQAGKRVASAKAMGPFHEASESG